MMDITPEMIEAAKSAYWGEVHHGGGYSDKCYEAAIQAALEALPLARGSVKPLEWRSGWIDTVEYANTLFGEHYAVRTTLDGRWGWRKPGCVAFTWIGGTKDEAKAAAQSDYEAHIRSALVSTPPAAPVRVPDWEDPVTRAKVLNLARKLWNEDQYSCAWSDENREHYTIRAAFEIALSASPSPVDSREMIERLVRTLEPFSEVSGEGDEDFPDETPVTVKFGRTLDLTLTFGAFREARASPAAIDKPEAVEEPMRRYDLFYDENNKPTMVERPGGSGQFVFANDADAEIARLNDELTCCSEAYHSIKALFYEFQKTLKSLLENDGGEGSKCYDARAYYDARKAALALTQEPTHE